MTDGILGEVVFLRGLEVLMSREWDFLQSSIRVDVPRQFGGAWFSPRQVESRVGPEVSLLESSSFRKIKGKRLLLQKFTVLCGICPHLSIKIRKYGCVCIDT